jgi:NAD(P)-dependent dehydrogenase (short-subunit alcohol dehydrogenase family)
MNNGIDAMPLGVIEPIQIAYLAEFLLSDKSKHITGAAIPVSSGV